VAQLVESLCDGNDSDNAFHTLIEADKSIIPPLIQQFKTRVCGADRARIIEVIWQHRDKASIPFLASALRDAYPEVWRHALDGLVAIGGINSHAALIDFRSESSEDSERVSWVDEAIGQIQL
jgi:HEAT repeat protein